MSESPNKLFKQFLSSFDEGEYDNHKYFDTITEISRKDSGKREPLIEIDYVLMYSLDDIKDGSKILEDNPPKTTDAIYYREDGDELILYLIEFKFHNLDDPDAEDLLESLVEEIWYGKKNYNCLSFDEKRDLNKIKQYYGDDVNHALILKPIESLKVVIPKLYEEYCNNHPDVEKIDIVDYLRNIEKKYFVFVSTYSQNEKLNPQNERSESQGTKLEKHFDRLISGRIIDCYEIWPRCDFEDFLMQEQFIEFSDDLDWD